jgi:hypothetical protein
MAIYNKAKNWEIIFDYLNWAGQFNEYKQGLWKKAKSKQYINDIEKYNAFSNLAVDLLSGIQIPYKKLLSTAISIYEEEETLIEYFKQLAKTHPELIQSIQKNLNTILKKYPYKSQFVKRVNLYRKLKTQLAPAVEKLVPAVEKEEITKQLKDIYFVFNAIGNKLSLTQQKKLHDIEGSYLNTKAYYSPQHVDELLNFYDSLPLPDFDILLNKLKTKIAKTKPTPARESQLNLIKSLPKDTLDWLIKDINYLQSITNQKISFGEEGQSGEKIEGLSPNLDTTSLKLVKAYVPKLEKLTGQKVIFE